MRSHDGRLQRGHPGVVLLALHSHAPLLPVAYYGAERYMENLSNLKRTDFHLRAGRLFHLETHDEKVTHQLRQKIMGELMFRLAHMLPSQYRGVYADASKASTGYLAFE